MQSVATSERCRSINDLSSSCRHCSWWFRFHYRASSYASAVLAIVILSVRPSVRPCVCLSHACFMTKPNNALQICWKGNCFSFLTQTVVGRRWPLPSEICTQSEPLPLRKTPTSTYFHLYYNVSAVRDSEKSSVVTNRKLTTGFPVSSEL